MEHSRFQKQEGHYKKQFNAAAHLHTKEYIQEMAAQNPDLMQTEFAPGNWMAVCVPALQVAVYQQAYRAALEEHKGLLAQEILQRAEDARRN